MPRPLWYDGAMSSTIGRTRRYVLLTLDTQRWHSPFSGELRRWRRSRIVERCIRLTRKSGCLDYTIYDAFENYLTRGTIVP